MDWKSDVISQQCMLHVIAYKLLVFTSSDIARPNLPAAVQQIPFGEIWHSYTTYLFLWQNIFSPSTLSKEMNLNEVLIEGKDKEAFLRTLYASMMLSFKRLVSLLNLSVSDAQTDLEDDDSGLKLQDIGTPLAPASGDIGKMQANNSKDFIIFQNLTDFWQKFLPKTCPELFGRWAFLIGDCLIELSAKNPLVSGFYKMFATCLQVCQSTQHFGQQPNDPKVKVCTSLPALLKYETNDGLLIYSLCCHRCIDGGCFFTSRDPADKIAVQQVHCRGPGSIGTVQGRPARCMPSLGSLESSSFDRSQ